MAKLSFNEARSRFEFHGTYKENMSQAKPFGYKWDAHNKVWWTEIKERAYLLRRFADTSAKAELGTFTKEEIPSYRRECTLIALKMLSSMCDGARMKDYAGFSKSDVSLGKELARKDALNSAQTLLGLDLIRIHQHQLPHDLLVMAGAVRR